MTKRVADKVAVVTGGAGGIGAATAKALVVEGAHVLITDIADDQGEATAAEIGGRFVHHDVTDADAWEAVVAAAEEVFGPVNILVNGAGIQETEPIAEITLDDYQRVMAINATSVFLGVNSVHPGAIRTPMLASLDNADVIEASLPMLPLGRAGEADEIANLILFLASDESSYSTGAEFLADGGWTSQ